MSKNITPLLERYEHRYNGIPIWVEIDYVAQKISLIEADGKPKKWLFAGREVEYMQGWRNILEAMREVINEAENRLRERIDEGLEAANEERSELVRRGLEQMYKDAAEM